MTPFNKEGASFYKVFLLFVVLCSLFSILCSLSRVKSEGILWNSENRVEYSLPISEVTYPRISRLVLVIKPYHLRCPMVYLWLS